MAYGNPDRDRELQKYMRMMEEMDKDERDQFKRKMIVKMNDRGEFENVEAKPEPKPEPATPKPHTFPELDL